jgi:hypothetical protein
MQWRDISDVEVRIWGAGNGRVRVEGEDSQAVTPHWSIFLVMLLIVFYHTSQQRIAVAENTLIRKPFFGLNMAHSVLIIPLGLPRTERRVICVPQRTLRNTAVSRKTSL